MLVKIRAPVLRGFKQLLPVIERYAELPVIYFVSSKEEGFTGSQGIFTRNRLRNRLEWTAYRVLDKVFPFVAKFIDWSTEHEQPESITKEHTRYSAIVCGMKEDFGQRIWSKAERVDEWVKIFKKCYWGCPMNTLIQVEYSRVRFSWSYGRGITQSGNAISFRQRSTWLSPSSHWASV